MNENTRPARRTIPPGAQETRWHAADGHAIRRIDWPVLARASGSILFLPGRGDSYEKYLETLDHWHRLGWNVTASDWRGQGDSGRLGADAVTGHINDFAVWIDDLAMLWGRWIADRPGPHVLAGHSMGGHLVLRAMAEHRVDPAGAILSAPMLGFKGRSLPVWLMHALAKVMNWLGDPRRPAWKWNEQPGVMPASRIRLLTHDADRYSDELWWREARPELVMGPGSWGWVERAYASMRGLSRPGVIEAIKVPVLILATDNDKLVDYAAIEAAAARLPRAELVNFGQASHHEILREADAVRDQALARCDAFLAGIATPA